MNKRLLAEPVLCMMPRMDGSARMSEWPFGDGEMTRRIRAHDWATTPLGPIEAWPPNLKAMVEHMLATPLVSSLVCGPQRLLLYNDAAARLYGDRHPMVLGQPLPASFPEGWAVVAPLYARAFEGETVVVAAQPLDTRGEGRSGDVFDAYLTPVRENEAVAYVHMIGLEIGDRLRADQRRRESEELLTIALEGGGIGAWRWDLRNNLISADDRFLALWGVSNGSGPRPLEEYTARMSAKGASEMADIVTKAIEEGEEFDGQLEIVAGPTAGRWVRWRGRAGFDDPSILYGTSFDVTEQRQSDERLRESEERQAFLLKLSDVLRPLTNAGEVERQVTHLLGEHLRADRCFLSPVYEDGTGMCVREEYLRSGASSVLGDYTFAQFGDFVGPELHAGRILAVENVADLKSLSAAERASYEAVEIGAYLLIPLIREGRLAAFLTINHRTPRPWSEADKAVARQTADRLWSARERGRVEEELRESEERQAFLLKLTDAMRPLANPVEIMAIASSLAGQHIGLDRCFYGEVDEIAGHVTSPGVCRAPHRPEFPDRIDMKQYSKRCVEVITAGETLVIDDVHRDDRLGPSEAETFMAAGIAACVGVPLIKGEHLVAIFSAHQGEPRAWKPSEVALLNEIAERTWAAVERARAETALRKSEERFQQFAASSSDALWIRDASTFAFQYCSAAVQNIFGVTSEAVLAEPRLINSLIIPEERDQVTQRVHRIAAGEPIVQEYRILRASDHAFRWIKSTGFPLLDEDGAIQRIASIVSDVTEAKLAVDHQSVLLAELQHRVRNIMAMIRSMTTRTGERAETVTEYSSLIAGRLLALSRVQALLTRAANVSVSLLTIVRDEIAAQAQLEGQYALDGPDIQLGPKAAEVLTLAIHELATNALKYGALSAPSGKITVRWQIADKEKISWLVLDWLEEGAPERPQPSPDDVRRRGFGSELIEARIPYELGGQGRLEIKPGGAHCHLEFPLKDGTSVLETGEPQRATVFGGALDMTGEADLSGRRVLVVEDDYYQAADIARALKGAGAEVIGPCPTEKAAQAGLNEQRPDTAVLDINLGAGPSFDLAATLKQRGIPFVFITGYDREAIPNEFSRITRLEKPVELRQIVDAVAKLID